MHTTHGRAGITRVVILIAGIFIILAGIKMAASIVASLLLAVFFAVLFSILIRWLEGKGAPHWLAVTAAIASFLAVLVAFVVLIVASFAQLIGQVPQYQSSIEAALTAVLGPMGIPVPTLSGLMSTLSTYSIEALSSIVNGVTSAALIVIATIFLLVEVNAFSAKIGAVLAESSGIFVHFSTLGEKIVHYVVIRTEVNLLTGIGIGLIVAAAGVEYAVFWGFLAFALSYIPYIGFMLAVVPPTLIAWSEIGLGPAAFILIGAAIINVLAENVLFPQAAGRGLQLSPAVVFISLMLWGYVLGSTGVLLAVPLTLALIMALQYYDDTRWLAILLGPADFVPSEAEPPGNGGSGAPE